MITPITATFPALNFPKEVDYPTQEDWAAFSAAAELNYGILSGEWSDKSEEFKTQTNNLALEIQDIGENAFNAVSLDSVEDLSTYTGSGLVMVKDINRGGTFVSKNTTDIDPNTGSLYVVNDGTVFAKLGGGFWARQYSGAVNVKWFGASLNQSASNNAIYIQSAVNNTPSSGCLIIDDYYNISSTITIPTLIKIKSLKNFNGGGLYGDIDGALISKSGQMWINDFEGLTLSNTSSGANASCIQGTLYRCSIKYCTFTCPSGKALNLLGNDYCVENIIEKNYFTGCKYGIYAQSNTHSNTDSFIIDNYFWSGTTVSTTIENSIYWDTPSGCTFRGNHPYGGSQTGMIRLIAGINVSIIDNYFESSDNCRLRIDGGNPSSYTITGNKFWAGDGTKNDISGDTSNIIKLSFSAFNRANLTFTGNIFEGGINNAIIFSLLNGNDTDSSNIKINFDKSNTIGGSYLLAQNATSGTSTLAEKGVIESDHPEFFYFSTSQSLSPTSVVCSEFFQKASGFSIGYQTLPAGKSWLTNRQIKIHNISTNMTMSFSTGAAGGITGNKATDVAKIFAGDSAILMIVDGNYFFMHDRS